VSHLIILKYSSSSWGKGVGLRRIDISSTISGYAIFIHISILLSPTPPISETKAEVFGQQKHSEKAKFHKSKVPLITPIISENIDHLVGKDIVINGPKLSGGVNYFSNTEPGADSGYFLTVANEKTGGFPRKKLS